MRRTRHAAIRGVVAAGLVIPMLAACKDSGLPHRNTPVQEAMNQEWRYPLYEAAPSSQAGARGVYTIGERRYIRSAAEEWIPTVLVRPIGIANGQQIVALTWESEPFDRLYLSRPDGRFQPLLRVP